jgi:threonine synthase
MNALRIEGQKTVVIEICQQLRWHVPDWVVLPSGNLGNGYAMYVGFRMMKQLGLIDRIPRLALAQAENANPLYRAFTARTEEVQPITAKKTAASAIQIGNPVSAPRAMKALKAMNGVVEQASEQELADAAAQADRTGLYVCPHTAVALAATKKLREKGTIAPGERVVVVSTANGLKFTEFKVAYHDSSLSEVDAVSANPPVELAADYGVVRATIEKMASDATAE